MEVALPFFDANLAAWSPMTAPVPSLHMSHHPDSQLGGDPSNHFHGPVGTVTAGGWYMWSFCQAFFLQDKAIEPVMKVMSVADMGDCRMLSFAELCVKPLS